MKMETHNLDPVKVLRLAEAMGGRVERLLLVGCEPQRIGAEQDMPEGLRIPSGQQWTMRFTSSSRSSPGCSGAKPWKQCKVPSFRARRFNDVENDFPLSRTRSFDGGRTELRRLAERLGSGGRSTGLMLAGLAAVGIGAWMIWHFGPDLRRYLKMERM